MHPSSYSSSSHGSATILSLAGYGSAPGNFLSTIPDSVAANGDFGNPSRRAFFGESSVKAAQGDAVAHHVGGSDHRDVGSLEIGLDLHRAPLSSYSMLDLAIRSGAQTGHPPACFANAGTPAGFLSHSLHLAGNGGGRRSHNGAEGSGNGKHSKFDPGDRSAAVQGSPASNFQTWEDFNSILFSAPATRGQEEDEEENGDFAAASEAQCGLPKTALEIAGIENLFQALQDTVPFKVRAKRGCATHPRSIAERERRTRISEKLRKLQELVPNMDKQTSTAEMLDLAVEQIKSLQSQVQKLNKECSSCNCKAKRVAS